MAPLRIRPKQQGFAIPVEGFDTWGTMTHASCTVGEFVQDCFYSVDGVHWLFMYSAHLVHLLKAGGVFIHDLAS